MITLNIFQIDLFIDEIHNKLAHRHENFITTQAKNTILITFFRLDLDGSFPIVSSSIVSVKLSQ